MLGCGGMRDGQVPKIHQAWGARYQYDLENRRITSKYNDKKIGRVTGRDEWGRVNYDKYWVMKPFKGEDLLKFHEAELDYQREARWDEANRNAIEARKLELSQVATTKEETENKEESDILSETEDTFLPAPFLPVGIEMEEGDSPSDFPVIENAPPPFPVEADPDAPSPFDPLPPL